MGNGAHLALILSGPPGPTGAAIPMRTIKVDVAIAGGGVAGLWIANLLLRQGREVAVCDPGRAAGVQTLASQGLIHGGIKYALRGRPEATFDALRDMPGRWRRCLAGDGEIDLRGVRVLSDTCYLWSRDAVAARLATFLASRVMQGRTTRVGRAEYPDVFAGQAGSLYRLDDFAIDVAGLRRCLAARLGDRLLATEVPADGILWRDGRIGGLRTAEFTVEAERFVFAAGAGNGDLAAAAGFDTRMQRRPLHQVLVHSPEPEPLFAHCIAGLAPDPALTVTTRPGYHYIGGALALDGVQRTEAEQIAAGRRALKTFLPWIDWDARRFETLLVDRAEPAQEDGQRPDQAFVAVRGNALLVWPVKLSLAPDLGDRVLRALGA